MSEKPLKKYYVPCARWAVWNYQDCYYRPVRCKRWTCQSCAVLNYREIRQRMDASYASKWSIKTHIIITLGNQEDNEILFEAFNDFITFIRRGGSYTYIAIAKKIKGLKITKKIRPYEKLQYIWALEVQHERFLKYDQIVWHLHIVVNKHIRKYDIYPIFNHALKLHGSKSDFNYIETRYPHNFHAGAYLSKYFTKEDQQHLLEKGANCKKKRRWSCSRQKINGKIVPVVPSMKTLSKMLFPWVIKHIWLFMTIKSARQCSAAFESDPIGFPERALLYEFVRKKLT